MSIDAFRIANTFEAEAIAHLVNQAYRPNVDTSGWTHESDWVIGDRTNPDQVAEIILQPESVILMGLNNTEIVACVHIEKNGEKSHIGMLAVSPALQGVGAGKQMLAYAENYAVTVFGSEKLVLVVVSQRAELIAFYQRRGYQKTGIVKEYPLSAGVGIPKQAGLSIEVLEKSSSV